VATPSTTTTPAATTTTAPRLHTASAVSASWVSPDHGWVLDQSGFVWATTDSGSTWKEISRASVPPDTSKHIRFADALHGFEFDAGSRQIGSLLATDDGGLHWKDHPVPFSNVADLAITSGTVYVASYNTGNATVDVWTAPVGSADWKRHPTDVPIGAGPVPTTQLVFSGSHGWLLQVDRTVVGGAQLTTAGRWAPWTPPCADAMGPAYLSASTPTDLVAACAEGLWGSPPSQAKTIYFSHDGGASFTRHAAPTFGPVLMANPQTAAVAGPGGGLQRTTDGGVSWHLVLPFDATGGIPDYGFTTSTQGFVILGGGEMLMTYDAGATWQPVTLP
jgi:photosystem II stability/assembly factor-like uncharacterized protein